MKRPGASSNFSIGASVPSPISSPSSLLPKNEERLAGQSRNFCSPAHQLQAAVPADGKSLLCSRGQYSRNKVVPAHPSGDQGSAYTRLKRRGSSGNPFMLAGHECAHETLTNRSPDWSGLFLMPSSQVAVPGANNLGISLFCRIRSSPCAEEYYRHPVFGPNAR